jgi:hypothetical protein
MKERLVYKMSEDTVLKKRASITENNGLMIFTEVIAVYSKNHKTHNTLGKITHLLVIIVGVRYRFTGF